MTSIVHTLRHYRQQGLTKPPIRGQTPTLEIIHSTTPGQGISTFIGVFLLAFITHLVIALWPAHADVLIAIRDAVDTGFKAGLIGIALYYGFPLIRILTTTLWRRQRPTRQILTHFSTGQKVVSTGLIALGLVTLVNHLYPTMAFSWTHHQWPHHPWAHHPLIPSTWHVLIISTLVAIPLAFLLPKLLPQTPKPNVPKQHRAKRRRIALTDRLGRHHTAPLGLWLGHSTGRLSQQGHTPGLAPQQAITLSLTDATQNLLILGGIGAGKTTRLMQPLLVQLFDQHTGGLIFDVKGDVKSAAIQMAEMTNRDITLMGPHHDPINLLAGLSPEIAASFLKSAFLTNGQSLDRFWIDTATERCRHALGVLSFVPEHYTLQGLYQYLFEDQAQATIHDALNRTLPSLTPRARRQLTTYRHYQDTVFATFDDKVKSGVNATIAQALSPFNHPDLIDAFCQHSDTHQNLQAILNGAIYLVDMPLAHWGLGAKVAYTFIKLRFFNLMQNRIHHPEWDQDRPIFFMCDEYQELISANKDGLSDLNFWDKSRSSKTLGIVSAQSLSSLYAAIGNRDLAHAIVQNFRQKLCFRTEDQATLTWLEQVVGQAPVHRETKGRSQGHSTQGFSIQDTTQQTDTQSITLTHESVLTPALFRSLSPNQAVAILSINSHSADDVIDCLPVYL
jgi:hypothetical protein